MLTGDDDEAVGIEMGGGGGEPAADKNVPPPATLASLLGNRTTRRYLLLYWGFSFVVSATDEMVPLFALSTVGGLQLVPAQIGSIMALSGAIYLVFQ
jgi:hypothetical protein